MAKSNGIASLKQAAKLLNKHSPDGESLAYINPAEARLLKSHGGSGIETLSGVPSYDHVWWHDIYQDYIKPAAKWLGYEGDEAGGKLLKDVTSLGGGALGWLESAELSDWKKEQFKEQKAKEIMNELRFAKQTDSGAQLLAPQNVPSTIEDVSRFTEVDIPTMKTTAAQGGRIGAFNGGIQGLMPQQGMPQQGMPQQGMPQQGLMPRMGYALGEEVEQVTEEVTPFSKIPENIKTADLDDIPDWWLTDFEELIQDFRGDHNGQGPQNLNDLEKWHRFKYGKAQGPNIDEMLNIGVTDENTNPQEIEQLLGSMQAAHGGRIGAQGGGIMPLLDMGGMEKDYRQEGGFVPIGRREKADDVPARLSKNEFVFTADAAKAAGGGDIDEGAQRMYNVMKNLEAGGEISEQSQGQA